jgi:hypothetical protein
VYAKVRMHGQVHGQVHGVSVCEPSYARSSARSSVGAWCMRRFVCTTDGMVHSVGADVRGFVCIVQTRTRYFVACNSVHFLNLTQPVNETILTMMSPLDQFFSRDTVPLSWSTCEFALLE